MKCTKHFIIEKKLMRMVELLEQLSDTGLEDEFKQESETFDKTMGTK